MSKQYRIDSFKKLLNLVNKGNAERLSTDLAVWLLEYSHYIEKTREAHPEQTKALSNTEIAMCKFLWVDDGKIGTSGVEFIDNETGEVTKINFANPK